MLAEILRFELRCQMRQPVFLLAGAFFFLSAFLAVTTDAVVIGGSIGNVDRNAPFVILRLLLMMSIVGVFATTAFVANSVLRGGRRWPWRRERRPAGVDESQASDAAETERSVLPKLPAVAPRPAPAVFGSASSCTRPAWRSPACRGAQGSSSS